MHPNIQQTRLRLVAILDRPVVHQSPVTLPRLIANANGLRRPNGYQRLVAPLLTNAGIPVQGSRRLSSAQPRVRRLSAEAAGISCIRLRSRLYIEL
jgi:hypothetical protein